MSLKRVPSVKAYVPNSILLEIVRKCLRTVAHSNKLLIKSAIPLAKLMDDSSLMEKTEKLSYFKSNSTTANSSKKKKKKSFIANDHSSLPLTSVNIPKMEEDMCQAARKLELFKQRVMMSRMASTDCGINKHRTWTLAKNWNPCPIGLLPRIAGPSGYLPSLNLTNNSKDIHELDEEAQKDIHELDGKETQEDIHELDWKETQRDIHELDDMETQKPRKCGVKRDASVDLMLLGGPAVKKRRETKQVSELNHDVSLPIKAEKCLTLNMVCKSFTEEECRAIKSSARLLV